jgi:hypothetical protein
MESVDGRCTSLLMTLNPIGRSGKAYVCCLTRNDLRSLEDQKSRTDMDYVVARTVPTLPRVTIHAHTEKSAVPFGVCLPCWLLDCEVKSNPIRVFSAVKHEVQFKVAAGVCRAINQVDAHGGLAK